MTEHVVGRPDWRNPDDYPSPDNTNMDMWAWEFMRRNHDFLRDCEAVLGEHETMYRENRLPTGWNESPLGKVLHRWGVKTPYSAVPGWAEKFGSPMGFEKFPRHLSFGKLSDESPYIHYCAQHLGRVPLEFDVMAPIGPQLERAKAILEATRHQKDIKDRGVRTRNNEAVRMFPHYLRLLDAKTDGIGNARLAEFFWLGDDTISKQIEKAEALRDGGYKQLLEK